MRLFVCFLALLSGAAALFQAIAKLHAPNSFAALPLKKNRVAVVGAGGDAGACVFGFIQRAAQTFDSGLSPPRALVGSKAASRALNGVLGSKFILAYAGEDLVKLTSLDTLCDRLGDCDAAVVTPQGFEWSSERGTGEALTRILEASRELRHVVLVAPAEDELKASAALQAAKLNGGHTLLLTPPLVTSKKWNFNQGLINDLELGEQPFGDSPPLFAEDLSEVVRLSLVLLDPSKRRTIHVRPTDGQPPDSAIGIAKQLRAIAS